jgi:hypothetical protein
LRYKGKSATKKTYKAGDGGELVTLAYEFYKRRERTGDQLIGILPERRRDRNRITQESIMNWVKVLLGHDADKEINKVYFVCVDV